MAINMRAIRAKETRLFKSFVQDQRNLGNAPKAVIIRYFVYESYVDPAERMAAVKVEFSDGKLIRMTGSARRITRIFNALHEKYARCL